ncbi:MAG TPA: TetR/AcrR family transcriptional regulator, partial [Nitrospirota bacterium]
MLVSTNKRGRMLKKDTKTRQAEIVSAAIGIIGETGVRGLTTARLAGRLGMSEPNLYRHFADKQAILCAV